MKNLVGFIVFQNKNGNFLSFTLLRSTIQLKFVNRPKTLMIRKSSELSYNHKSRTDARFLFVSQTDIIYMVRFLKEQMFYYEFS